MKFASKTEMDTASYEDVAMASRQRTIVELPYPGLTQNGYDIHSEQFAKATAGYDEKPKTVTLVFFYLSFFCLVIGSVLLYYEVRARWAASSKTATMREPLVPSPQAVMS